MQEQRWSSRAAGIGENLADRAGRVYLGVRTNPGPVTTRDLRRDLGIVLPKLWCILGVLEAIGIVDSIYPGSDLQLARESLTLPSATGNGLWITSGASPLDRSASW
ncbi:hypothetical protein KUCAC02_025146 [Chaenocephalus aceratus]|nr:hypothetical protein KUCAC02_025146 [Chaenocephalus aceratus]